MLLDVKNLAVSYAKNSKPTIQDVTFGLDEGKILAIVGESGSGKTTVIRAILNVLPGGGRISNGSIVFDGKNLLELDAGSWRSLRGKDISMIFQDSGAMMNPVHTIGKQFIEYIQVHSDLDKKSAYDMAVEKLELMNLPNPENILKSYTFELSGGMRQRVGIAMAITFQPKLLLADEPTSALDVTTQAQIVGESGCGKTTLLKAIMNMQKPTSGKVIFHGEDITQLTGEAKRQNYRHIQMVFQDPTAAFNPKMKIRDIVCEPLLNFDLIAKSEVDAKARELLTQVDLPADFVEHYPHNMSGGQRQRVAIARALALEPEVIACDEATSALDVSVQDTIIKLLVKLQREKGITYIFICHDLALVIMFSHRIAVMENMTITPRHYLFTAVQTDVAVRFFPDALGIRGLSD